MRMRHSLYHTVQKGIDPAFDAKADLLDWVLSNLCCAMQSCPSLLLVASSWEDRRTAVRFIKSAEVITSRSWCWRSRQVIIVSILPVSVAKKEKKYSIKECRYESFSHDRTDTQHTLSEKRIGFSKRIASELLNGECLCIRIAFLEHSFCRSEMSSRTDRHFQVVACKAFNKSNKCQAWSQRRDGIEL